MDPLTSPGASTAARAALEARVERAFQADVTRFLRAVLADADRAGAGAPLVAAAVEPFTLGATLTHWAPIPDRLITNLAVAAGARRDSQFMSQVARRLRDSNLPTEVYQATRNLLAEAVADPTNRPNRARLKAALRRELAPGKDSPYRAAATRIARTETTAVWGHVQSERIAAAPGWDARRWVARHDKRTRPSHLGANGQVVANGEPFTVGGWSMMFPGDPNGPDSETANCRCVVTAAVDVTMLQGIQPHETPTPPLDLAAIQTAKTSKAIGEELQRALGARGTVSGFDHPSISAPKAMKAAEQIARLSTKYPEVRFDVSIEPIKHNLTLASARHRPGKNGEPDQYALVISRSKMTARSKTDDMLEASAKANHWRVAEGVDTDAMTYVVTHEFGHLIDFTSGNHALGFTSPNKIGTGKALEELAAERGLTQPEPYFTPHMPNADPVKVRNYHAYNDLVASQVSNYAKTNPAEAIAEAFADVEINGALASEVNHRTVARLLEVLRHV